MIKARIAIPSDVAVGDSIEIKTLVSHPMESGFRLDYGGEVIPRAIIETFEVRYLDEQVFTMQFGPGIAANPYVSFYLTAEQSGQIEFIWMEQGGEITEIVRDINVTAS